jgi:hypothetical protein
MSGDSIANQRILFLVLDLESPTRRANAFFCAMAAGKGCAAPSPGGCRRRQPGRSRRPRVPTVRGVEDDISDLHRAACTRRVSVNLRHARPA